MADLSDVSNFINDISGQAAAWYRGVSTGGVVVTPTSNPQLAAQQQIALQQAAQANLYAQNPTLGGILSNPLIVILLVGLLVVLLIVAFK